MKVIWSSSLPLSAGEIIESLKGQFAWSPKTVRTLITRLVQKEVVGIDLSSKNYRYYSLFEEEKVVRMETQSFLKKVRGRMFKPFLVQFLDEHPLSKEELDELRSLLDQKEE